MAKFPIPENCSAYVPMILKEFCSSKINRLVMKGDIRFCRQKQTLISNLQSRARTHAVLVIGLYELLSNPLSNYLTH
jgi:hypothetical protein